MPTRCSLLSASLAAFCIALAAGAMAADGTIYTWVDKQGITHYSDTPPPGAKPIDIDTAPTDAAAVAARQQAAQQKLQDYSKQHQAAAAAEQKTAQKKQAKAAECSHAAQKANKLAGLKRVQLHNPDGTTSYLSGDELAKYKQEAREKAATLCHSD